MCFNRNVKMSWNLDFIIWEVLMISRDVTAAVGCRVVHNVFCFVIRGSHSKPTVVLFWWQTRLVNRDLVCVVCLGQDRTEWNIQRVIRWKWFELPVTAFMWGFHSNVTQLTYSFECPAQYYLYWHNSYVFSLLPWSWLWVMCIVTHRVWWQTRLDFLDECCSWLCECHTCVSIWGCKVVICMPNVNNCICCEWVCVCVMLQ